MWPVRYPDAKVIPGILSFRIDAALYFANCKTVQVRALLAATGEDKPVHAPAASPSTCARVRAPPSELLSHLLPRPVAHVPDAAMQDRLAKVMRQFDEISRANGLPGVLYVILDLTPVHHMDAMGLVSHAGVAARLCVALAALPQPQRHLPCPALRRAALFGEPGARAQGQGPAAHHRQPQQQGGSLPHRAARLAAPHSHTIIGRQRCLSHARRCCALRCSGRWSPSSSPTWSGESGSSSRCTTPRCSARPASPSG